MKSYYLIVMLCFVSHLLLSQYENRYNADIEDVLWTFQHFAGRYIVLDRYSEKNELVKLLLMHNELQIRLYEHTTWNEDFIDSLRVIIENKWVIVDNDLALDDFQVSNLHYTNIKLSSSLEIYNKYFNDRGLWNGNYPEEEMRAAVAVLVERGYAIYFTKFSTYDISKPPR